MIVPNVKLLPKVSDSTFAMGFVYFLVIYRGLGVGLQLGHTLIQGYFKESKSVMSKVEVGIRSRLEMDWRNNVSGAHAVEWQRCHLVVQWKSVTKAHRRIL